MLSLDELNPMQRQAATHGYGPLLILAGAGSGKTKTLTHRLAYLILNMGVKPENILAVSFTNKAAKELKERVVKLIGRKQAKSCQLSTFHSLGVQILREQIHHLGMQKQFSIYDTADQLSIIREAMKVYQSDKKYDRKQILMKINNLKNKGIEASQFVQSPFFEPDDSYDLAVEHSYHFYQDKMKFYNAIDFDDILHLTVKLFKLKPELAQSYSKKYQFVMIDEYQDTNPLQWQLVQALTSTHNNICVVGDDDQSIYGFRGADISNILEFENKFQGCNVIKLEQNYRSTTSILNLANEVIQFNKIRKPKKMWSNNKSDVLPKLWLMGDTDHEAAVVADDIHKFIKSGGSYKEVAILYRSNTQFPPLEEELRLQEIPYQIIGGQKFYEKKEIKDLTAYLCLMANLRDEIGLRRIINTPNRGIGNTTLSKFLSKSQEDGKGLFLTMEQNPELAEARQAKIQDFTALVRKSKERFKTMPLSQAVELLINDLNFDAWIDRQYDIAKQAVRRKNEVLQFIESAKRFEKYTTLENGLREFLEKVLLRENQEDEEEGPKNEVTMMTLHSSKGLEFERVYLIGMEEGLLPHKRTIEEGTVSEERRLAYVGITRAKKDLIMTQCKERVLYGKKAPRFKSRFLLESKGLYLEQDRTTFSHLSIEEAESYKQNFFADLQNQLD